MRPFQLSPIQHLHLLNAGYCTHREWVTIRGGTFRSVRFPAGFACIEHPTKGLVLFDTGYSERFLVETSSYPASLYRYLTPVYFSESESALAQLQRLGYDARDVAIIIISHFHGDHISGLRDFPRAQFIYAAEAYDKVRDLEGLAAVRAGYLPKLLPDDFQERSIAVTFNLSSAVQTGHPLTISALSQRSTPNRSYWPMLAALPMESPFTSGIDLFGDGSLIAVDLPGHADGQIGLFLSTNQQDYFLCADAAWSSKAIRHNLPPHLLAGVIMSNRRHYQDTFHKLIQLNQRFPSITIVPSHCNEIPR
ncbi:Metallo-beta-lactamase superfamily protein [Paenibacillus sp. 1_12]|uniref:MBL fold metallo-hydrolase n=1 Tax=Paenibacillus sp. 1_12 TaxID=1566278 RepID=UPI0008EAA208|nr:MBL fold metallo-hydrolase [Paenibacillus sp. 1_12]SFK90351.1 Metallo-beta-lactamase superfamily protein [Paenibacillus sp. 1_12]